MGACLGLGSRIVSEEGCYHVSISCAQAEVNHIAAVASAIDIREKLVEIVAGIRREMAVDRVVEIETCTDAVIASAAVCAGFVGGVLILAGQCAAQLLVELVVDVQIKHRAFLILRELSLGVMCHDIRGILILRETSLHITTRLVSVSNTHVSIWCQRSIGRHRVVIHIGVRYTRADSATQARTEFIGYTHISVMRAAVTSIAVIMDKFVVRWNIVWR